MWIVGVLGVIEFLGGEGGIIMVSGIKVSSVGDLGKRMCL